MWVWFEAFAAAKALHASSDDSSCFPGRDGPNAMMLIGHRTSNHLHPVTAQLHNPTIHILLIQSWVPPYGLFPSSCVSYLCFSSWFSSFSSSWTWMAQSLNASPRITAGVQPTKQTQAKKNSWLHPFMVNGICQSAQPLQQCSTVAQMSCLGCEWLLHPWSCQDSITRTCSGTPNAFDMRRPMPHPQVKSP